MHIIQRNLECDKSLDKLQQVKYNLYISPDLSISFRPWISTLHQVNISLPVIIPTM